MGKPLSGPVDYLIKKKEKSNFDKFTKIRLYLPSFDKENGNTRVLPAKEMENLSSVVISARISYLSNVIGMYIAHQISSSWSYPAICLQN